MQYEREKKKVTNEKGVNQFSEVKAQNEPQPSTAEKLAQQHNVSRETIKRDAEYAKAVDTIVRNTAGIGKAKNQKYKMSLRFLRF